MNNIPLKETLFISYQNGDYEKAASYQDSPLHLDEAIEFLQDFLRMIFHNSLILVEVTSNEPEEQGGTTDAL